MSLRRLSASLTGLLMVVSALLGASLSAPPDASDLQPAFASTCIGYCKHPTNAGKVFLWGLEDWREEFEVGSLGSNWHSDKRHLASHQNGMLTIEMKEDTGSINVWPDDQSASYGRWESRVRAVELSTDASKYRFTWELIPTGDYRCGANSIVLASYQPGDERVGGAVRTLGDHEFTFSRKRDLRSRAWHSYAVEVTPTHISWFVDTRVIRTERRPAALSGVTLRPRFRIEGVEGEKMNPSRMQMDWVRYYTLKRTNAQSIEAPQMRRGTYADAC